MQKATLLKNATRCLQEGAAALGVEVEGRGAAAQAAHDPGSDGHPRKYASTRFRAKDRGPDPAGP